MSMHRYRLFDAGYPTFKKIVTGRKWIGRVCKTQTGYFGIIGKTEYRGTAEDETFREVVARHCGFPSHAAMTKSNSAVRAVNKQYRAEVKQIADDMIRGDFSAIDRFFKIKA